MKAIIVLCCLMALLSLGGCDCDKKHPKAAASIIVTVEMGGMALTEPVYVGLYDKSNALITVKPAPLTNGKGTVNFDKCVKDESYTVVAADAKGLFDAKTLTLTAYENALTLKPTKPAAEKQDSLNGQVQSFISSIDTTSAREERYRKELRDNLYRIMQPPTTATIIVTVDMGSGNYRIVLYNETTRDSDYRDITDTDEASFYNVQPGNYIVFARNAVVTIAPGTYPINNYQADAEAFTVLPYGTATVKLNLANSNVKP